MENAERTQRIQGEVRITGIADMLGCRYSTSLSAIRANRLAKRPPAKTTDGRREAAPRYFVDEGGVSLSDLR